jgi:hypothetical protein
MDNAKLDTYQLDLLMVVSWGVLSGLKLKKPQCLSDITLQVISTKESNTQGSHP